MKSFNDLEDRFQKWFYDMVSFHSTLIGYNLGCVIAGNKVTWLVVAYDIPCAHQYQWWLIHKVAAPKVIGLAAE